MKRLIAALIVGSFFFTHSAFAFYYKAECLVPQGKFKKCFLDFSKKGSLKINFKNLEFQGLNREIRGKDIQNISLGEKAKRRWAAVGGAIYALGPLGALFLLWKKKMALFGVEYRDGKDSESIMFGVKKKEGFPVSDYLQSISGQTVDYGVAASAKK